MIYLDNAATTRMSIRAAEAMQPFFTECYGNPSSVYRIARKSKEAILKSRDVISRMLGAESGEIIFTSGGTESDNWALTAAFEANCGRGSHIITSAIEHPAVLRTCEYLENVRGAAVSYVEPDSDGIVHPETVAAEIRPETILISIMTANNEVGSIQPIREIGILAREKGILFHTDAVQAFGHIPLDVEEMQIDLLSASAHKFGGPKGCGFLYIRKGSGIGSMIRGGAQEHNRRAGTENVPGIAGTGAAAEEAAENMEERAQYISGLRNYMISRMLEEIPGSKLNGSAKKRLPNNINLEIPGISAESALIMLDLRDICASAGSACASGSLDPSHVLLAMGRSTDAALHALRFTLSHETTREEADITIEAMKQIVNRR